MAFSVDESGNITLIQGDSGTVLVSGLNTDKNYAVYFAIQDKNRKPVINEMVINSNKSPEVVFELSGELTDLLEVKSNESVGVYYYGIKVCDPDDFLEDTLIVADGKIGSVNTITVYPKKVEGI